MEITDLYSRYNLRSSGPSGKAHDDYPYAKVPLDEAALSSHDRYGLEISGRASSFEDHSRAIGYGKEEQEMYARTRQAPNFMPALNPHFLSRISSRHLSGATTDVQFGTSKISRHSPRDFFLLGSQFAMISRSCFAECEQIRSKSPCEFSTLTLFSRTLSIKSTYQF